MTDASFRRPGYALLIKVTAEKSTKAENIRPRGIRVNKSPKRSLKISSIQKSFWQYTWHFLNLNNCVGSNKTDNRSDRSKITHAILPDDSYSTIVVERMWLFIAIELWNNTHCRLSQQSSWFSLEIRTQSHVENTSQNPGRYPVNTHWLDNIFLRCCRRRTILIHSSRQWEWFRSTNLSTEKTISVRCERIGCKKLSIHIAN